MKKAVPILKKVILVLFLLSLCVAGLCAYAMFGSNTADTDDISYYRALTGEIDGASLTPILGQSAYKTFLDLPALTELESYIDYRFNFTVRRYGLFRSHSAILVVIYSDEGYTEEKMKLSQKYTYLSEKIWGGGVVCDHSPVFSMDNFGFHAIEVAPDNYPKRCSLLERRMKERKLLISISRIVIWIISHHPYRCSSWRKPDGARWRNDGKNFNYWLLRQR